jgi:CheY-like chemotaxis protein
VLTVMVIDDEPDVRLIARLVLTAADFEVLEVEDGAAAMAQLEAGNLPDVLLVDVRMPNLDGWGLLTKMRDHPALGELPVVVLTADAGARSEAPAVLRDTDVLLTKPFQADDLLRAVQSAVGQA